MPGKPSRRDRRRAVQGGAPVPRRPKPSPAVRPARPARPEDPGTAGEEPDVREPLAVMDDATTAEETHTEPSPQRRPGARPATRPGGRRPGGTNSARALELQREQRVQRDAIHDMKIAAVVAGISILALVVAVVIS